MTQKLEKATIKILRGRRAGEMIDVLFNPTEYSHEISNTYDEKKLPGLRNPVLRFVNGDLQTLSMDLFFDTWTDGSRQDVSRITKRISNILQIDSQIHEPSEVEFSWGALIFKAYIVSISQRFTMFNADGTPVRATLSVTFKQFEGIKEQLQKSKLNSADKTKTRVLTADDSLWALAEREYGDASQWRLIARANRISNPLQIDNGTVLILPPLDEVNGA